MPKKWTSIPSFPEYEVSSDGVVRSLVDRYRNRMRAGQVLSTNPDKDGYTRVNLYRGKGKPQAYKGVHCLVVEAFIGPIPKDMQVNHKNGIRDDNSVSNLEIVTCIQNIRHSMLVLGSDRKGEKNSCAKLIEDEVVNIREQAALGEKYSVLAADYGVTQTLIGSIVQGKIWGDVGGPIGKPRRKSTKAISGKFTDADIASITSRRARGEPVALLASECGVSGRTIRNWCEGKTRKS